MTVCASGAAKKKVPSWPTLGGVMVRALLGERREINLGRVVLLGTPIRGTELVDLTTVCSGCWPALLHSAWVRARMPFPGACPH